jgi:tetratricopeptide (TPR) repeat protein
MTAVLPEVEAGEVSVELAKEELQRLLGDERFRASERQRDILIYLAERRFSGHRENVKAYSIALDVLGRPADFDASIDPIVRIEISRLRTTLISYYSVFGAEFGVSIDIPKGSYVAVFLTCPPRAERPVEAESISDTSEAAPQVMAINADKPLWAGWKSKALLICAGSAALALAGWMITERPVITSKPTITLSTSAVSPDLQGDATVTRDSLMTALSQFDTVIVTTSLGNDLEDHPQYNLELKYYGDDDDRLIWWQLIDHSTGRILKADLEKVYVEGKAPAAVRLELAGAVARKVASAGGAVNIVEVRDAPANALGNACVVRAEVILNTGGDEGIEPVIRCLEQTVVLNDQDVDARATLAKIYALNPDTAKKSLELSRAAVSMNPLSSRANSALMSARFANGRIDAAIDAGNRALVLNPNDAGTAATLGLVLFSAGYWKAATNLAQESVAMDETPPRNASLVLALEAYRTGEWEQASLHAEQALGIDPLTKSIRVAALANLGSANAKQRFDDARQDQGDFEIVFRKAANVARLRPDLMTSLEMGLSKAGANFDTVASISRP